jgi:hypothetical protein
MAINFTFVKQKDTSAMEGQRANKVFRKAFLLLALGVTAGFAAPANSQGQDPESELPAPVIVATTDSITHDSETTPRGTRPQSDHSNPVVLSPVDGDPSGLDTAPAETGPLDQFEMVQEPDHLQLQRPLDLPQPEFGQTLDAGTAPAAPIEKYGEAPVDRTPQFLRSVAPLLPGGKMQIDCGFVYSLLETDFPVLFGGTTVAETDVRLRSLFVPLAMRYGVNDCTQLFLNAPLGWYDTELATPFGDESDSEFGIGDVSFGVTRLLAQNSRTGRSLVGTLRATAPTGNSTNPFILTDPGTGVGVWQLGGDFLIVQNLDPIIMFYGAGYSYRFEEQFSGFDVQLGHEFAYNLGLGFAVNERVTLSTAFRGAYFTETEVDGENVPNSDSDLMQVRFAATIAKCARLVEPFVTIGLTERSPAAQLGVIFTRGSDL